MRDIVFLVAIFIFIFSLFIIFIGIALALFIKTIEEQRTNILRLCGFRKISYIFENKIYYLFTDGEIFLSPSEMVRMSNKRFNRIVSSKRS